MENFRNILRWLSVLPGAILALVISYATIKLIVVFSQWFGGEGPNPGSPYALFMDNIVYAGISGYVFLYFGTKIAPSYKKETGYVLAGLILILGGMFLVTSLSNGNYWEVAADIFTGVGALIALYQINSGELDVEGEIFSDFRS